MSDNKVIPFAMKKEPTSETLELLYELAGILEHTDLASTKSAIVAADPRSEGCREFVHEQVKQAVEWVNDWIDEEKARLGGLQ